MRSGSAVLHAVDDRGEVRRFVERGAVALLHDERGQFFLVAGFGDVDDEGAFALDREAALLQVLDHRGDERVDVAFAFPPVELDAERVELAAHAFEGDGAEVLPTARGSRGGRLEARRSLCGLLPGARGRLCMAAEARG